MKFTIHGIRGSTPNPSGSVLKYGGNTSCYEISTNKHQLFFDTGTGFIKAKIHSDEKDVYVLYSHFHHDHIQGLAFNPSIFATNKKLTLTSGLTNTKNIQKSLQKYFSGSYFPVDIFKISKNLKVVDIEEVIKKIGSSICIKYMNLNHPGGAVGYSVTSKTKKIVILLDNEFTDIQKNKLVKFCKNADLIIWDGMFTDSELTTKQGWGHSSIEEAIRFTELSKVKRTLICHHAPDRTDEKIDAIKRTFYSKRVEFGYEKMVITL